MGRDAKKSNIVNGCGVDLVWGEEPWDGLALGVTTATPATLPEPLFSFIMTDLTGGGNTHPSEERASLFISGEADERRFLCRVRSLYLVKSDASRMTRYGGVRPEVRTQSRSSSDSSTWSTPTLPDKWAKTTTTTTEGEGG
ncbi:hypothetical protein EYF80_057505 [Liparis tanakae]|uniref:Uncharacterized protein n=1 Tax=Liparis tanakae TaxID=230148 RepID=A0A4Z2EVE9_9TELE|nr:hypothetical protein EYF80_057505 [Liparis tanakae]